MIPIDKARVRIARNEICPGAVHNSLERDAACEGTPMYKHPS